MSQELIELIRYGYTAWNSGDRNWVLEHLSPDIEWQTPPEDPEAGTYRGHAEVQKFWDQWSAAVGQLAFKPEEVIAIDGHVIVTAERSGRGEHSGLEVSDKVVQVFTFANGLCISVREYYNQTDALRSVGLDSATAPAGIPIPGDDRASH